MSLVTQKALPSCCANWTLNCCRTFSSSSGHQAAAQAKVKAQTNYRQGRTNFNPIGSSFQRDPPPRTSSSPAKFDSSKPFDFRRPPQQNKSGANNSRTADSGWGTKRPNPNDRANRAPSISPNNRTSEQKGSFGSSRVQQSQARPPYDSSINKDTFDQRRREQQSLYAANDGAFISDNLNGADTRVKDRGRNREREMNAHALHAEKEVLQQRSKVARQVLKNVPKLPQIHKAREIFLPKHVSVLQLSRLLNVRLERLQTALRKAGMAEVSYDHLLNSEDAALLAPEFGCNAIIDETAAFDIYPPPLPKDISSLPHRPPVVTIMGHVDHGKTTLLDTLRSASVAQGEAGGITQHIGAFSLPVSTLSTSKATDTKDERMITFLDTPGHAAFSAMRARGALVTDVIVLVVAADDGVMPQTKEVIDLVKKEQGRVGLVIAINKIDKPGADADTVRRMLLAEGVQLEEFGGEVPAVEVSGLTGKGLDNLMETVSLVSELMDIRAEPKGVAVGHVLESKNVKGFGPVATVLNLRGELTTGSNLIAGQVQCRVRTLTDSSGKVVKSVSPGMAVSVSGWKDLPNAGDEVVQATEDEIKRALINRKRNHDLANLVEDVDAINEKRRMERERRQEELEAAKTALEKGQALPSKPLIRPEIDTKEDGPSILRIIIKADVSGSAEAVAGALEGIGNDKAKTKIVQYTVGNVTEGDVVMAHATGASIVAFGVQTPRSMLQLAHGKGVEIVSSDIIYRLMETVREKVAALLPPVIEHRVAGEATVQEIFEIDLKGRKILKVAGCRVANGALEKSKSVRLVRGGEIIYTGTLDTFRHMKKDITEAKKGMECGLSLLKYDGDYKQGDVLQSYDTITKPAVL